MKIVARIIGGALFAGLLVYPMAAIIWGTPPEIGYPVAIYFVVSLAFICGFQAVMIDQRK